MIGVVSALTELIHALWNNMPLWGKVSYAALMCYFTFYLVVYEVHATRLPFPENGGVQSDES